MSEATLRNYVRKGLHAKGVLTTHHEDAINTGIPDLSYSYGGVHGWIELKWLEAWPKREDTPMRLPHYTKEQKHFLLTRGRAGGRCWLLIRVGKEHLILHHEQAYMAEGRPRGWFYAVSDPLGSHAYRIDFDVLTRTLTR